MSGWVWGWRGLVLWWVDFVLGGGSKLFFAQGLQFAKTAPAWKSRSFMCIQHHPLCQNGDPSVLTSSSNLKKLIQIQNKIQLTEYVQLLASSVTPEWLVVEKSSSRKTADKRKNKSQGANLVKRERENPGQTFGSNDLAFGWLPQRRWQPNCFRKYNLVHLNWMCCHIPWNPYLVVSS